MKNAPTKNSENRKALAEQAFAVNDAVTLKRLFDESCEDLGLLMGGMRVVAEYGDKYPQDLIHSALISMQEVALEAIALARDVAIRKSEGGMD